MTNLIVVLFRYYPVYKAFRSDSSFNFMVFFMMFFFQFLVLIYQTLGFYGTGYTGYFSVMKLFDSSFSGILLGLLGLVIAVGFTVCAAGNFFLLTQVNFQQLSLASLFII